MEIGNIANEIRKTCIKTQNQSSNISEYCFEYAIFNTSQNCFEKIISHKIDADKTVLN